MTRLIDTLIGIGWIAFWVYWFAMATRAKRPMVPRGSAFALIRLGVMVLIVVAIKVSPRSWGTAQNHVALSFIGLTLFVLGLALAIWARVYIGRNWGMPMSRHQDTELVTTGPYRFIRHPIYTGVILAMAGTAIGVTLYWLIVAIAFGAYFIRSATVEEKDMARLFPKTYPGYRARTKMLLPFIF